MLIIIYFIGGGFMIRHICMFKLQEVNKDANLAEALSRLDEMKSIDLIKNFQVVTNFKEAPVSNYDLSLIFDFETMDDLNAYQKHPIHVEFGKFITSVRESRACIDYEF
jgi:hypothetical protein